MQAARDSGPLRAFFIGRALSVGVIHFSDLLGLEKGIGNDRKTHTDLLRCILSSRDVER